MYIDYYHGILEKVCFDYLVGLGLLHASNVGLQIVGHLGWQVARRVVEVRNPVVDLVQLQEDARRTLVVAVVVLLGAWRPSLNVHIAHLTLWWWLVVVAVVDVLTTSGSQTRSFVY